MLPLRSIQNYIHKDKVRKIKKISKRQHRFFTSHPSKQPHSFEQSVMPSSPEDLYRIDHIKFNSYNNQPAILKFNLLQLVWYRIAKIQGTITPEDIVRHQGSTRLIGTTSSKESALKLSNSWRDHRNAILYVNPAFVQNQLIDVEAIVKQKGTGFYTKYSEHEHALTALPLSAVREIRLIQNGQTVVNPLYIESTPEVIEEFQTILTKQLIFLARLYEEGKSMTSSQRQAELTVIVEQLAEFFHARLEGENPFNMTLLQFCDRYDSDNLSKQLSTYSTTMTVLELLKTSGDELFMKNHHYSKLLGQKELWKAIEHSNEENGYSSRYSYSFD
ncbi:hypothetical protein FOG18_08490 [Legionella israelensis]|uniref:hypothetical protein n=1 Tax=Legionella israelensis TaxID=454 RepID=UPI00117CC6D8|nr:hypothetical protein [Legionella israelensis]QDP72588.1 hypothetical protein FOG18_08490 [Legionella israelensis]